MSFASEAALSSLLRYGPQKSALRELMGQAEQNYRNSVQAGQSAGVLDTQTLERALPEERAIFNRAEQSGNRAHELLAPTLASLTGTRGQGFQTAAANERAFNQESLARERASAMNQLQQERVAASQEPGYSARAAGQTLASELAKLITRENTLAGQEGAYSAGEEEKLRNAANKEAAKTAAEERKEAGEMARLEKTLAQRENASHLAHPGGPKQQSQGEQAKAANAVQSMLFRLEHSGLPRSERARSQLIEDLSEEVPSQSIETKSGKKVRTPKMIGYPVGPQMNAAIDQWIYGYVNPVHQQHLKEQGYNVKALGLTRYEERPPEQTGPQGIRGEARAGR